MTQVVDSLSRKYRVERSPEKGRKELSEREIEVVDSRCIRPSKQRNCQQTFISEQTVKTHLSNIFQKLEVNDRLELALYAMRNGLVERQ